MCDQTEDDKKLEGRTSIRFNVFGRVAHRNERLIKLGDSWLSVEIYVRIAVRKVCGCRVL